jgi:hypothetical protein
MKERNRFKKGNEKEWYSNATVRYWGRNTKLKTDPGVSPSCIPAQPREEGKRLPIRAAQRRPPTLSRSGVGWASAIRARHGRIRATAPCQTRLGTGDVTLLTEQSSRLGRAQCCDAPGARIRGSYTQSLYCRGTFRSRDTGGNCCSLSLADPC